MLDEAISRRLYGRLIQDSGRRLARCRTLVAASLMACLGIAVPGPLVAQTFNDVPQNYWAYTQIETVAANGITAGCGGGNYCPLALVTRAQMAVFLERGMHGSDFRPPAAKGNVFLDVGAQDFAASFIEQLFLDGITKGCGSNNYCPGAAVTRAEMAVFLLRAKHGTGYSPPPATGMFSDVPLNYWAVHWIEQLAREGITGGCGGSKFCPEATVTRDQMAVFLARTFPMPIVPPTNAAVGGLWYGTTTISGQGAFYVLGMVAENGKAFFLQEDGVMYWGTVRSSGNQLRATLDGAGLDGSPLADGSASGSGPVSGTIEARTSVSANATFTTANNSTTTSTISLEFDPLYNDDSSLALIAGDYLDATGYNQGVLHIATNGNLTNTDPQNGCVYSGRIAVINSAYNMYDVQISVSGCTGEDSISNGVTFRGLITYDQGVGEIIGMVQASVGGNPNPTILIFDRP
jgi:hypothetical protein